MTKTLSTPLVVPETVRRKAGLRRGDQIEFRVSGRAIMILPKGPAEGGEFTPAERRALERGLAQSEKEYRDGLALGPFDTHEAFLAALHAPTPKRHRQKTTRRR
jgi:bifunctional DNA-binding transcriptional regulator/antitoxin component of YhaV-PrlF toxin-antitoxin module